MKYVTQPDQIVSYNEAGVLIAEVRFPKQSENIVLINRTFVDPSLRGQGVANELLVLAYDYIKANGLKAIPTCTYAVTWFKRHPEHHDVLVKGLDLDNPELLLKEECAI